MLRRLSVKDFVIVTELELEWQAGFTVPRQHVRTSRNFSLATFRDLDPTQRTTINALPG